MFLVRPASAKQTLEHIILYIGNKLFLRIDMEKTVVAYAGKIYFLGYGFYKGWKGFRLRLHAKTKGKMKVEVKQHRRMDAETNPVCYLKTLVKIKIGKGRLQVFHTLLQICFGVNQRTAV